MLLAASRCSGTSIARVSTACSTRHYSTTMGQIRTAYRTRHCSTMMTQASTAYSPGRALVPAQHKPVLDAVLDTTYRACSGTSIACIATRLYSGTSIAHLSIGHGVAAWPSSVPEISLQARRMIATCCCRGWRRGASIGPRCTGSSIP
eukprot:3478513-Rhodomonas_salina.2